MLPIVEIRQHLVCIDVILSLRVSSLQARVYVRNLAALDSTQQDVNGLMGEWERLVSCFKIRESVFPG